jgi:Spy/CpxP family protein refolding chaperone
VRQDNRAEKIADKAARTDDRNADQAARNADKVADKSALTAKKAAAKAERATDKTERSGFNAAHDQKLLAKGIRLTLAEKKQLKAIEKKYDAQYRTIRKNEVKADNAARKNGTTESDATFQAQLSQLQMQERTDMRAVLTSQQQSIFDSNVTKLSAHK